MDENEISKVIVDTAIEVHSALGGPGLLESIYQEAQAWELLKRGLEVESEKIIPIIYKGHQLGTPLRLDLLAKSNLCFLCVFAPLRYYYSLRPCISVPLR